MATACKVCNKMMGIMTGKVKIADGYVCTPCFENAGFSSWSTKQLLAAENITSLNMKRLVAGKNPMTDEDIALIPFRTSNIKRLKSFVPTQSIGDLIAFDDMNMQFCCGKEDLIDLFNYKNIVDYELLESGGSVSKGSAGSAIAGGILFGSTGAIVGAAVGDRRSIKECDSLRIKITLRETYRSVIYIDFIKETVSTKSPEYRDAFSSAQLCMSLLKLACEKVKQPQTDFAGHHSEADELRKFKQLMDEGIISEEEFLAKKKMILGI